MKKILAIMGSPRKGEGYDIILQFEKEVKSFEEAEFEYIFLRDKNLSFCKGCLVCITKGESLCPSKGDDRDYILNKMMQADGIIFSTPSYSLQVSGYMKNLFDRLAYIFHRPCFFGKTSIALVNQGIYGGETIVKYLNEVSNFWGFNTAKGAVFTTSPGIRLPKDQNIIETKIKKAAQGFVKELNRVNPPKPSIYGVIMFRIVRGIKPYISDTMPYDYEYFKQKGWMESDYFYEVKLGLVKRIVGKFMDKQAVKMGEKMLREQNEYKRQIEDNYEKAN